MPQLVQQYVHVFWREVGQPQYRPGVVGEAADGEAVLRQTAAQRVVAVQSAPGVHQEFGRAAEQHTEPGGLSLQTVVDDAQHLLVVAVTG